jgi:hypothetical protein
MGMHRFSFSFIYCHIISVPAASLPIHLLLLPFPPNQILRNTSCRVQRCVLVEWVATNRALSLTGGKEAKLPFQLGARLDERDRMMDDG